jgi:mRNA-degrading endonuclease RelE of RelBE toxin-antitoxin system
LRELKLLPRRTQVNILAKLVSLAGDPHSSPQVKGLKGSLGRFRLPVGAYRVVYSADEKTRTIKVERIRHRREAYR